MHRSLRRTIRKTVHAVLAVTVRKAAPFVPSPALRSFYRRSTRGFGVAVCLHRVARRPEPGSPVPEMTTSPGAIDSFLRIVADCHDNRSAPLVMCFDDGYADAIEYVGTRAPRYPDVDWMVFVCPEKAEKQAGFRWDLLAGRGRSLVVRPRLSRELSRALDPAGENDRPDLRAVALRPEYRLASVEQCRKLARLPNVTLGNHSNVHFRLTDLPVEEARRELARSSERFEKLFGRRASDFAFPFGGDGQVGVDHVASLRATDNPVMWTTQGLPFAPENRTAGSVLPRFVFLGNWSPRAMALWIAVQSVRQRVWPRDLNETFGRPTLPVVAPALPALAAVTAGDPTPSTAA